MVGQPDRDLSARRDEALARLAVTSEALAVLDRTLQAEPDLPEATARALLAGARALCPAAASTGAELAVSAGPDHQWTVSVRGGPDGPRLHLRRPDGGLVPAPSRETAGEASGPAPDPGPDVAVQLADLLRASNRVAR